MIYKKFSKTIIFSFLTLLFSGCLQEASYIENCSSNESFKSNKNSHINKNKFEDEDYNKKNNNSFNISKNPEEFNNDEIKWNNVFEEYHPEEIKKNKTQENNQNKKIIEKKNKERQIKKSNNEKKQTVNNLEKQKNQDNSKQQLNEKKLIKPVNGQILSKFKNNQSSENGISFKAKSENIFACNNGRVIYVDKHGDNGKTIIIKFNNGIVGSYVFNGESFVEINTIVEKKTIIGKINLENGKNILYFSTRENGKLNNPEKYFID